MKLTKAEEIAFLTIAGHINRVLQADDAMEVVSKGLAEQAEPGRFTLTPKGIARLKRVRP